MEFMSPTIGNLAAALAQAQQELVPVARNAANPAFNSKYADLSSCLAACRSILPKYKLSVSQVIEPVQEGKLCVVTILMHESGEWLSSRCVLPAEGGRGVNAAQAVGSAITYARRYGFAAIVGLGTDDDDGNASGEALRRPHGQDRPQPAAAASCAEPRPRPQRQIPRLTSWQVKALMVRLAQRGMDTKEKCLEDLSAAVGRRIHSSRELSYDDFKAYMNKALPPERPAVSATVPPAACAPCPPPAAKPSAADPVQ